MRRRDWGDNGQKEDSRDMRGSKERDLSMMSIVCDDADADASGDTDAGGVADASGDADDAAWL